MKMLNKQMVILAALVLGLAFVSASYAAPADEEQERRHEGKANEVLEKLNLSAQQEAQIKEIQKINRERAKDLRQGLKEKRMALGEELDKPNSDPVRIKALVGDLKDIEGRLIELRVDGALKMKEILSPDQYRTFSETLKKIHKDHMGKRKKQS